MINQRKSKKKINLSKRRKYKSRSKSLRRQQERKTKCRSRSRFAVSSLSLSTKRNLLSIPFSKVKTSSRRKSKKLSVTRRSKIIPKTKTKTSQRQPQPGQQKLDLSKSITIPKLPYPNDIHLTAKGIKNILKSDSNHEEKLHEEKLFDFWSFIYKKSDFDSAKWSFTLEVLSGGLGNYVSRPSLKEINNITSPHFFAIFTNFPRYNYEIQINPIIILIDNVDKWFELIFYQPMRRVDYANIYNTVVTRLLEQKPELSLYKHFNTRLQEDGNYGLSKFQQYMKFNRPYIAEILQNLYPQLRERDQRSFAVISPPFDLNVVDKFWNFFYIETMLLTNILAKKFDPSSSKDPMSLQDYLIRDFTLFGGAVSQGPNYEYILSTILSYIQSYNSLWKKRPVYSLQEIAATFIDISTNLRRHEVHNVFERYVFDKTTMSNKNRIQLIYENVQFIDPYYKIAFQSDFQGRLNLFPGTVESETF